MVQIKPTSDPVKSNKEGLQTYIIIECQSVVSTKRQKAVFTKIDATDFTDALLKFKEERQIKDLPSHTMIIPESAVNYYPRGV